MAEELAVLCTNDDLEELKLLRYGPLFNDECVLVKPSKIMALIARLEADEVALRQIMDREHEDPLPPGGCTCDYGDNGYTCGHEIARKALGIK